MESSLTLDSICSPSEDVVAREIDGELIVVPLVAGIGDAEDALYTFNATGKAIWALLDGSRSLRQVADELASRYRAPGAVIAQDVLGLAAELARRKLLAVL